MTAEELLKDERVWNRLLIKGSPKRIRAKMLSWLAENERVMDVLKRIGLNASAEALYQPPEQLRKEEDDVSCR